MNSSKSVISFFTMVALMLCGCAKVNDKTLGWFSSSADAYVIVNGQVLSGTLVLIPDRTGRLSVSSESGPITSCSGGMRHTATHAGAIDLRCNDGSDATLEFTLITETRGYAYGKTAQGQVSLTFGIPPEEARAFLTVPEGKKLVESKLSGALELQ